MLAAALVVACQPAPGVSSPTPPVPTAAVVGASPAAGSGAPTAGWHRVADIPTGRSEVAAVVSQQQSKVFVIGGFGGPERVERYDPAADRWERAPDLPIGVDHPMAAASEGLQSAAPQGVFVFGGYLAYVALRLVLAAMAFFVVAAAIGGIDSPWGVLAIPAGVLGGAAFSAPLIAYAATRDTDRSFSVIMRLAIMPLFLFSGTFFPVHRLPDWLQPVAWFSPLFHAVELCRGAMRGSIAPDRVVIHLVVLIAVLVAGCWAGARTFRERLAP